LKIIKSKSGLKIQNNEIPYNLDEYDNIEMIKPDNTDMIIGAPFNDLDPYGDDFPKDRNNSKNFVKDNIMKIKQEGFEMQKLDEMPQDIQGLEDLKEFDNQFSQYNKIKTEEVETEINILEKNDLIEVYSFITKYNGTIQCSFWSNIILNNHIKVYCPECSHSVYYKVPKEKYEQKMAGTIPSNPKIYFEKDEFKSLGTKQKFSSVPRQKQNRRYKGSYRNKTPMIYCLNCLRNGIELGNHKNTHCYKILDKLEQPVFNDNFALNEEATYVHGILEWGMDNWVTLNSFLENEKDWKDLFNRFYAYYYDIYSFTNDKEDPIKYLENQRHQDPNLKEKAIQAMIDSLVISKNSKGNSLLTIFINLGKILINKEAIDKNLLKEK